MPSDILDWFSEMGASVNVEDLDRLAAMRTQSEQHPPEGDAVSSPAHYRQGTIELIDFIDDWKLGFYTATILQYLLRYKVKNGVEDLRKAQWYLERLIRLEAEK